MERFDFSFVVNRIQSYISDDYEMNQVDFIENAFASFFASTEEPVVFDAPAICRWFHGQKRISPQISGYYLKAGNREKLAADLEENILPLMYDSAMAIQEIITVLMQDSTISEATKQKLTKNCPCQTEQDQAAFLADVLSFAMERKFVKREADVNGLMVSETQSPILKDFLLTGDVPKPSRHFCGRERELSELHQLLNKKEKVFLTGIPGIGKSEVAKAYAKLHKKEYTNILYIAYSGDLRQDILDMEFADDLPSDSEEDRFRKHNRFLRSLKEDSLIIVDNFNTTMVEDEFLGEILQYRCRILFTTRCRFIFQASYRLQEITDGEILFQLASRFYSNAMEEKAVVEEITRLVHGHTLTVELAARLLENGLLEPKELLERLRAEKVSLKVSDLIGILKDGKSRKASYYGHIRTLFSLFLLSEEEQGVMRSLCLTPHSGIPKRLFARWMQMRDLNVVNDLEEKGFLQSGTGGIISLHPMIQEVALADLKPSVKNCQPFFSAIQEVALQHGEDISYPKLLSKILLKVIAHVENDDDDFYLRFLEDVFPSMTLYQQFQAQAEVLKAMEALLQKDTLGTVNDRALYFDYLATVEPETDKAIQLEQKALSLFSEIHEGNAHLISNIHGNLGSLYHAENNLVKAREHMEAGIQIIDAYSLGQMHDSISQIHNYAVVLCELGEAERGMAALHKLSSAIKEYNSDVTIDYATVQESMGQLCLAQGKLAEAQGHIDTALEVYRKLYFAQPERIAEKERELLSLFAQFGFAEKIAQATLVG